MERRLYPDGTFFIRTLKLLLFPWFSKNLTFTKKNEHFET
jgi:hypothetical protein